MSDEIEDSMLREIVDGMENIVIVEGCSYCKHQIINCLNHTHCSSLGFELICNCTMCGGTGNIK